MDMLVAKNVTKTYDSGKKIALKDFSLTVPTGSIYGLLGPNGAGKTSFIRIINQITKPDSGTITINGLPLEQDHIKEIGYMPEERGLYKNMTVGDQLVYFGELKGMSKADAMQQAKYWFDVLEIDHWWNKKLSELSKGMAQKIQFVVTVLHRPKLLILDEPFSGFDPLNANLIKDQIIRLKDEGTTIILSTHRMESVEEMCDRVTLIDQAEKVLDGKIKDVKNQFKKNIYNVALSNINTNLLDDFRKHYVMENENKEDDIITFSIKNIDDQEKILQDLLKVGKLQTFDEEIPTMNQIFIEAVQNNNSTK